MVFNWLRKLFGYPHFSDTVTHFANEQLMLQNSKPIVLATTTTEITDSDGKTNTTQETKIVIPKLTQTPSVQYVQVQVSQQEPMSSTRKIVYACSTIVTTSIIVALLCTAAILIANAYLEPPQNNTEPEINNANANQTGFDASPQL